MPKANLSRKHKINSKANNIKRMQLIAKVRKLQKLGQYVGSKWKKTNVLLENRIISKYIPLTKKLDQNILVEMLNDFDMVYLKPVRGTYGSGVMRLDKVEDEASVTYKLQSGTKIKQFTSIPALYKSINKRRHKRRYMIQQGIHLLKHKKRIFDLRIMVQKNPAGKWESTGIIGRVAHPHKIVTNYHSGGTPMPFKTIFKRYLADKKLVEYDHYLKRFGQEVARAICKKYPLLNMLGIDVGVDKSLYPWIIEVNTNPDVYIFKKLKNKQIFNKVYAYARKLRRA